jgi:hypothetical protein
MRIQTPVNAKYFAVLNKHHAKYLVKQDHVVPTPIYEGIERKSLKITGYEPIFNRYAAFIGAKQSSFFALIQMLERNLQMIDADEQKNGPSVIYVYLRAKATHKMLHYLDTMINEKDNGLSAGEKNMLLGLAIYYYDAFEDKRAQYEDDDEEEESTEPINSNNQ